MDLNFVTARERLRLKFIRADRLFCTCHTDRDEDSNQNRSNDQASNMMCSGISLFKPKVRVLAKLASIAGKHLSCYAIYHHKIHLVLIIRHPFQFFHE